MVSSRSIWFLRFAVRFRAAYSSRSFSVVAASIDEAASTGAEFGAVPEPVRPALPWSTSSSHRPWYIQVVALGTN